MKQESRYSNVSIYNHELSKCILQIPSMFAAEPVFHYAQGLNTRAGAQVERPEPSTLQKAMAAADIMKSLLSSTYSSFGSRGHSNERNAVEEPGPMQNESMIYKKIDRPLVLKEEVPLRTSYLLFVIN